MSFFYDTAYNPSVISETRGGFAWKDDGSKLYVTDIVGSAAVMHQYSVSPAWDLGGTVSYDSVSVTLYFQDRAYGLWFGDDGNKLYTADIVNTRIREYDLTTAWDITTTTYVSYKSAGSASQVILTPDGEQIFIFDIINDSAYARPLSTAWDLSTLGSSTSSFTKTDAVLNELAGINFNSDGTKLFVAGITSLSDQRLLQYDLTTPYDLDSFTNKKQLDLDDTRHSRTDEILFSSDGSRAYFFHGTNFDVIQYDVSAPWEVGWGSAGNETLRVVYAEIQFNAAASSVSFTVPSAIEDDDIIFFWCHKDDDAGNDWACTGFTQKSKLGTSAGNDQGTGLLWKVASSESGTYSVGQADTDALEVMMIVVRGADTSDPFDSEPIAHHAADNSATPTSTGITPNTDGALLLFCHGSDDGGNVWVLDSPTDASSPVSYDIIFPHAESSIGLYMGASGAIQETAGNVTPQWNGNDTSAENHLCLWAVKPGATALTHYSMTAEYGAIQSSGQITRLAYTTAEDIRDENQLGINDVDFWDTGDAIIIDAASEYLELEVP